MNASIYYVFFIFSKSNNSVLIKFKLNLMNKVAYQYIYIYFIIKFKLCRDVINSCHDLHICCEFLKGSLLNEDMDAGDVKLWHIASRGDVKIVRINLYLINRLHWSA